MQWYRISINSRMLRMLGWVHFNSAYSAKLASPHSYNPIEWLLQAAIIIVLLNPTNKSTASLPFNYQLTPLSETAALLLFDNKMDSGINALVNRLHRYWLRHPFDGLIETVSGYNSLAIFTDVWRLHQLGQTVMGNVAAQVGIALLQTDTMEAPDNLVKTIPVRYHGPDIEYVAQRNHITVEELIALHTVRIYQVFMMGFQPGFGYMGITDERIYAERKLKPIMVAAGSVGLAGNQTGVYPKQSPGGWQIIGRTECCMFDAESKDPFYLQAGDQVRFIAV
jgi:inhibitor of KinA